MTSLPEHAVVFGEHDENTLAQFAECSTTGNVVRSALMADGHLIS